MSFIENMTAESVSMDPVEFESYTSGKSVPLESWRSSLLMCDGLQTMSQDLKTLTDLKTKHDQILSDAKTLHADMEKFKTEINTEVETVLERTSYSIRKRGAATKEPVNIDAEIIDEDVKDLPVPLMPDAPNHSGITGIIKKDVIIIANTAPPVLLEDYLSASDNMSMLSLDLSNQAETSSDMLDHSNLSYRGFSAQSFSIPSISCDNVLPATSASTSKTSSISSDTTTKVVTSSSSENVISPTSTSSSSPMISAAESPDTERHNSEVDDNNEPAAVRVLSGIFETFDNLL
jgi:gas vesicle protein